MRLSRSNCAYLVAVLGAALTVLPRAYIGGPTSHIVGTAAMIVTMLAAPALGGWKPGLTATLLIVFGADFFLLEPRYSFWIKNSAELLALTFVFIIGGAFTLLGEGLHIALRRLRDRQQRLEQEVAERRSAELLAREQSERLRVTLASIGDATITTDAEGCVTFLNPTAELLTEWSTAAALGKPISLVFQIVNEFTGQPVEDPVVRVLQEKTVVGLANHTVLISRKGARRPIDDSAAPIRDDSGQITGVVLVFRDVSERRRAEVDRARLAAIVESSIDAIVSKTLEGVVTTWNVGAERLYGYTTDEMVGTSIARLTPPDQVDELPGILRRLAAGERIEHYETRRIRTDGRIIDVSVTISPVKDAEGNVVGAASIMRDISERKRLEQELRRHLEQLAEADRRKDEFLAMLAHELRNPLAPIRNALQIMRLAGRDGAEFQAASETMERQVAQMVRLVDDLLDVSRVSRGRIELRKSRVELAAVVHNAVDAAQPFCNGQQIAVAVPAEPIYVHGDPVRLTQALGNLLNNACKFTEPDGQIGVSLERQNGYGIVRVRDNGLGIAADQLERIFELFTQVDTSLERSQSGLGIGLTLVRSLVEMHAGTVEAHSAGQGQGCEFVVRLPIESGAAEQLAGNAPVAEPQRAAGRRILVVDDNRDAALTLATLLRIMGNETRTAHDGEEAVALAEAYRPEVILLDIGLPKLNGYDTCRAIRAQPWGQEIVIAALTGWGQEEDRRKSKEAGFNDHLVKPVDAKALFAILAGGDVPD